MIPNGYLIFEDESFLDSTVAKMNALRKSGQFCDVRLQVFQTRARPRTHDLQAFRQICETFWRSQTTSLKFGNTFSGNLNKINK